MTDQPTTGQDVALRPERQWATVQNVQPLLDTHRFEHFQRAAKALMHSSILNESVRGSSPEQCFSNLMLVFDLSDRWKLPPMSIAQGIAIVHNKVVYEGKLITAMLDASLGVRLHYWWTGERGADSYRIYVSDRDFAELAPGKEPAEQAAAINALLKPGIQIPGWRIVDGSVAEWRTYGKENGNGPRKVNGAWVGAATQNQLAYRGAREWARRYEPAQMLGVYGDDEIDAITLRMEARDVTPAAPGLSGGFTRPVEPVQDAEIEPIEPQEPRAKPAARKGRAKASDAPQEPESGQGDDPKREAVLADRKAALEKARDMGHAAGRAAWTAAGDDVREQMLADCETDEQRGYVENGWADGRKGLDQNLEDAYALGKAGTPTTRADWFEPGEDKGDDADRRWERIHAEWKRGADDGAAEREQDADDGPDAVDQDVDGESTTGDDALDAIREAEPDMVDQALQDEVEQDPDMAEAEPDAFDAYARALANLGEWRAIKASLAALTKTDAWASATPDRHAEARRLAWVREAALIEAGDDRMDFINDLTAFRCWMETTADVDAINGNWQALVRQPIYQNLTAEQKASLEAAVLKRVEQIQSAGGNG